MGGSTLHPSSAKPLRVTRRSSATLPPPELKTWNGLTVKQTEKLQDTLPTLQPLIKLAEHEFQKYQYNPKPGVYEYFQVVPPFEGWQLQLILAELSIMIECDARVNWPAEIIELQEWKKMMEKSLYSLIKDKKGNEKKLSKKEQDIADKADIEVFLVWGQIVEKQVKYLLKLD